MKYPRHIWEQIRGIKIEELQRVALHYHPGKTFPEKTLRGILEDIGWQIEDLIALKLIR
jgi:predicted RNA binding protein YcfA (HicA-like mRNA interferase family)